MKKNKYTNTWNQVLKRPLLYRLVERQAVFRFPLWSFGKLSVPIPEVQCEFTEHTVNFQK